MDHMAKFCIELRDPFQTPAPVEPTRVPMPKSFKSHMPSVGRQAANAREVHVVGAASSGAAVRPSYAAPQSMDPGSSRRKSRTSATIAVAIAGKNTGSAIPTT
jgi:hypothetical protein